MDKWFLLNSIDAANNRFNRIALLLRFVLLALSAARTTPMYSSQVKRDIGQTLQAEDIIHAVCLIIHASRSIFSLEVLYVYTTSS
jgi:hypothetical protein